MQTYMQSDDLLTVVPFEYVPGIYVRSIYVFYVPPTAAPARVCGLYAYARYIKQKIGKHTFFIIPNKLGTDAKINKKIPFEDSEPLTARPKTKKQNIGRFFVVLRDGAVGLR